MTVSKKHFYALILPATFLLAAFFSWDYYMRSSWDDNIVSEAPKSFFAKRKENRNSSTPVYEADPMSVPDLYKRSLDITEQNGNYYWINNNNMQLHKTIENGGGFKWVVLTASDKLTQIRIQTNNYLASNGNGEYGCFGKDWTGNAFIQYDLNRDLENIAPNNSAYEAAKKSVLDKDLYLESAVNVTVYENFIQYFFCK